MEKRLFHCQRNMLGIGWVYATKKGASMGKETAASILIDTGEVCPTRLSEMWALLSDGKVLMAKALCPTLFESTDDSTGNSGEMNSNVLDSGEDTPDIGEPDPKPKGVYTHMG